MMRNGMTAIAQTNGTTMVTGLCRILGHPYTVTVNSREFQHWRDGMLMQDAMPSLDPLDAEFLVSGITPEGWCAVLGDESVKRGRLEFPFGKERRNGTH